MTSQTLPTEAAAGDVAGRPRWMRTLAAADPDTLAAAWQSWQPKPAVQAIRGPEAGLLMVRARIGGGGGAFQPGRGHRRPRHRPAARRAAGG